MILSSAMFLLDPLLLKYLIDSILPKKNIHLLLLAGGALLAIHLCRLGLSALAGLTSFRMVQRLSFRLRLGILEQMNRLSADYHETTPVGEKLFRIEQDVDQVAQLGSTLLPCALQASFNTMFVIVVMFVLDFKLASIVLPLVPLLFAFRKYFAGRLRSTSDLAQFQSSRESSFLQEHISSIIQVQALHQESDQIREFVERATTRIKAVDKRNVNEMLFRTFYMALIAASTVAILGYGSYQVLTAALTVGGLAASYSYIGKLFEPLNSALEIYSLLNRMGTSISRIFDIIQISPSVTEAPTAVALTLPVKGHVEMADVSFYYGSRQLVIENLNFSLQPGEKVALVGVSGSGKSTVAKLIARLYDVQKGCIYIDGIEVRNIQLESLRRNVCYLMQESILFDRTLRENLLLGRPSATPQQLRNAVEIAELQEVLERLPNGLDTPIGPRGNFLSGGERQRVALARAVIQEPSLLLLDESTSALDAPSECRIFAKLVKHFSSQTIILISHRISALTWVDRIVALNQGIVEEQGTHEQLINQGGLYTYLHNTSEVMAKG
jgi:ABC-type multidrug transport system fused ATPase/permease subunit